MPQTPTEAAVATLPEILGTLQRVDARLAYFQHVQLPALCAAVAQIAQQVAATASATTPAVVAPQWAPGGQAAPATPAPPG